MSETPEYINQLNEQQRQAVLYLDGPELVIAGAGSGKTRVLTYKIVHLLHQGFEPWRILALTFTNKAAREMRERIQQLLGERGARSIWMGTFHSIFSRILRANADRIGFKRDFTIYDASDSKSLVKSIIKQMDLDDKIYKPSTIQGAISWAKNALLSPEDYANNAELMEEDRRSRRPRTAEIYAAYRDRCFRAGAMDFDDLLYYANVLLRDNPDVRQHYQEFFRYVLVDEYQDTNFAQHVIVSQLCGKNQNLCVVGDDAQSIYSFRGANIKNILHLQKQYPQLATFKLEQNYRSTRHIIDAANTLIEKNREQIPKTVFSKNAQGDRIEVAKCYSDFEEAAIVASRITQVKMATHDSYEEFAILYRTNAQSRILEESLRKRNIPYRIYGGLSFYQRKEVKDAIAYFRLSVNPNDDEALRRVINYPTRGIGETTINKCLAAAGDHRVSLWTVINDPLSYGVNVNRGTIGKLQAFAQLIQSFIKLNQKGADAERVAKAIIASTGLLAVLLSDKTPESISKQENLNELLNAVATFVQDAQEADGEQAQVSMTDFLADVSLATDQDEKDANDGDQPQERVTLMTVHAAKGLEFGNVFIVGVEEDLFPSQMAATPSEVEEERRLLYVALTRAKRFCMITYANSRFRQGQTQMTQPSRFLRDIATQHLKYVNGAPEATAPTPAWAQRRYGQYGSYGSRPQRQSKPQPEDTKPTYSTLAPGRRFTTEATAPKAADEGFQHMRASQLAVGMRIRHSRFGEGTISSIDTAGTDERVRVDFDNHTEGTKTLLLKYASIAIIDA